jgi:hypothetical protein
MQTGMMTFAGGFVSYKRKDKAFFLTEQGGFICSGYNLI